MQNIGAHFAAYEVLQRLGFGFLHPLQPLVPEQLNLSSFADGRFDLKERPYFPIRGVHYHTEHPLELMEFLNGFDVDYSAPVSAPPAMELHKLPRANIKQRIEGATKALRDGESWESMIPEFERAMEWTVANKQNRWEWILLYAEEWDAFAWSDLRKTRISRIVDIAHAWGVVAGAGKTLRYV